MNTSGAARPRKAPTNSDGRRARADASRRRIVEAMLELAREGEVSPSAEAVADRAGVGRRTVFRLFSDMESVYRELHEAMRERIEYIRAMPIEGETWRERLDCLIERRVKLFEEMGPVKRAADVRRHQSPFLQDMHGETTRTLRQMLLFVLPKAIKDEPDRLDALDAVLSIDVWQRLRREQGLSLKAALRVWKRMVSGLVD
jgi:AcrR family transcriptional regulator